MADTSGDTWVIHGDTMGIHGDTGDTLGVTSGGTFPGLVTTVSVPLLPSLAVLHWCRSSRPVFWFPSFLRGPAVAPPLSLQHWLYAVIDKKWKDGDSSPVAPQMGARGSVL